MLKRCFSKDGSTTSITMQFHGMEYFVSTPRQTVVDQTNVEMMKPQLKQKLPFVLKPMMGHCHDIHLIQNETDIHQRKDLLDRPFLLQEFIPHDTHICKIYSIGAWYCKQMRDSAFSQNSVDQPKTKSDIIDPFVDRLVRVLRLNLGLHIFNFDLIKRKDVDDKEAYYIIDVNYFPGLYKAAGCEEALIRILEIESTPDS